MRGRSAWWDARAAALIPSYPLMGTDWNQHDELVDAGIYRVQIRTETPAPAAELNCNFADEPPLTPEEEETAGMLW